MTLYRVYDFHFSDQPRCSNINTALWTATGCQGRDRAEKAPDALASLARFRLRTAMPTCPLFPGVRRPTRPQPVYYSKLVPLPGPLSPRSMRHYAAHPTRTDFALRECEWPTTHHAPYTPRGRPRDCRSRRAARFRGRAAREGFEAAVDELDLVGGYIDTYIHTLICISCATHRRFPASICLPTARPRTYAHAHAHA